MAEPLDDAALEALEERARAATPGEWSCWNGWGPVKGTDLMAMTRIGPADCDGGVYADVDGSTAKDLYATRADAEHIATANPSTVLALVAEVRALRADNERLTADLDFLRARNVDLHKQVGRVGTLYGQWRRKAEEKQASFDADASWQFAQFREAYEAVKAERDELLRQQDVFWSKYCDPEETP